MEKLTEVKSKTETKHTPGYDKICGYQQAFCPLHEAAPELLAACRCFLRESLQRHDDQGQRYDTPAMASAKFAITKAEGR